MTLNVLILISICVALDSIEHLLFRMAGHYPKKYFTYVTPAVLLYIIGVILWFEIIKFIEIGIAVPLMGSSYIVTALLSKFLFKETIDTKHWIGILVILLGVVLLAGENA